MSKERARLRAEREAARAELLEVRAVRAGRAARRRALQISLVGLVPRPVRSRRPDGVLARRRRAQNRAVLVVFLLVQLLAWMFFDSWAARLSTLGLSVFLVPVAVTLLFDRRS